MFDALFGTYVVMHGDFKNMLQLLDSLTYYTVKKYMEKECGIPLHCNYWYQADANKANVRTNHRKPRDAGHRTPDDVSFCRTNCRTNELD